MGWFVPQVLGVGYGYVGSALNGSITLKLMLRLVVLKLLGVTAASAGGNKLWGVAEWKCCDWVRARAHHYRKENPGMK